MCIHAYTHTTHHTTHKHKHTWTRTHHTHNRNTHNTHTPTHTHTHTHKNTCTHTHTRVSNLSWFTGYFDSLVGIILDGSPSLVYQGPIRCWGEERRDSCTSRTNTLCKSSLSGCTKSGAFTLQPTISLVPCSPVPILSCSIGEISEGEDFTLCHLLCHVYSLCWILTPWNPHCSQCISWGAITETAHHPGGHKELPKLPVTWQHGTVCITSRLSCLSLWVFSPAARQNQ